MLRHLSLSVVLCAALAACGGGGSTTSALPPAAATSVPASLQHVVVSIKVPASTTRGASALRGGSAIRRVAYVSAGTQSASIAVNGGSPTVVNLVAGSPNCTSSSSGLTCTITVNAPVGASDTFSETLYSGLNGAGSVLSQGQTTAPIIAGQANVVALVLSGKIASLSLALGTPALVEGTAGTQSLVVNFIDASGNAIIGSDPFLTAVTLTDTDASGATNLTTGSTNATSLILKSPADAASLGVAYSGSSSFAQATISAAAGSIAAPSLKVTAQAAATPSPQGFNDYPTFGYDNQRDVFNPNSTAITTTTEKNIHLAWYHNLKNYNTQTQPILATGISGHTAALYVGGGSGTVYAIDGTTGNQFWKYETGQETYTCENNNTIYFGIGGSAAYDPASKSIYIVGNSNASPNAIANNVLYHLDATTGTWLGQVDFAPAVSGWNSLDFSHTSVTLGNNGLAYVGTGATCDKSSWRGRVVAINVPSMTINKTFYPDWDPDNTQGNGAQPWGGGGIWGWGGVSIDPNGFVLTGVGNTDNGSTTNGAIYPPFVAAPEENSGYGEALVKLSPGLSTVLDSHHPIPTSMISGDSADLDLQGTPMLFTPSGAGCDPMAAVQAKSGTIYFYDETRVGHGPVAQFQLAPSTYADGFIGGPSYSPATNLVYVNVSSSNESLFPPGMVAIDPGCGHPSIKWHAAFGPDSYAAGSLNDPGQPRGIPAASAGGVVFVGTICTPSGNTCGATTDNVARRGAAAATKNGAAAQRKPLICCAPAGTGGGALWALDASTGTVLNGGNPLIITPGPIRMAPTIDGNWLFVIDNAGNMYGLTIDPSYPSIDATMHSVDSRMLKVWEAPPAH